MSEACREWRAALGAAALGGTDPAGDLALRAHLDGCAQCRAELRELTSVAHLLPLTDPDGLPDALPQPSSALSARVLDRVARERQQRVRHRRRRVAAAAGAALLAAAAIVAVVMFVPSSSSGTKVLFPTENGARASATLRARPAGTEVAFRVQGLHPGDYYWLWVTGDDGDRIPAGTFQGANGPVNVTMTAAVPLQEARRVWVTDAQNNVVLDTHLQPR
jgi:putative zinc finger protein/anti-sigma-K factor RskA